MRAVDDVLLARLRATGVTIHDSEAQVSTKTPEGKYVVTYPLPYAVYRSNLGDNDNLRLSGRKRRTSVYFDLVVVGLDRNQVKWAGEKLRAVLIGKRIEVPGYKSFLCDLDESQRIWRDDDSVRPDGGPLFYAVDMFAMSVTPSQGN